MLAQASERRLLRGGSSKDERSASHQAVTLAPQRSIMESPTRVWSSRDNTFLQMIDRFAPICLENHPLISLSEDISLSERMLFVDFLSFAHKGIPRTIPNALLNQDIASLFDAVNPSVCLSKPRWFESRLVMHNFL